eukprot:m.6120 g.6120  ORF g.6120 m.6120 type:complete len:240 (+) comp14980_c0_seq2:111-830(+)
MAQQTSDETDPLRNVEDLFALVAAGVALKRRILTPDEHVVATSKEESAQLKKTLSCKLSTVTSEKKITFYADILAASIHYSHPGETPCLQKPFKNGLEILRGFLDLSPEDFGEFPGNQSRMPRNVSVASELSKFDGEIETPPSFLADFSASSGCQREGTAPKDRDNEVLLKQTTREEDTVVPSTTVDRSQPWKKLTAARLPSQTKSDSLGGNEEKEVLCPYHYKTSQPLRSATALSHPY